jgi:hypothetical protein
MPNTARDYAKNKKEKEENEEEKEEGENETQFVMRRTCEGRERKSTLDLFSLGKELNI